MSLKIAAVTVSLQPGCAVCSSLREFITDLINDSMTCFLPNGAISAATVNEDATHGPERQGTALEGHKTKLTNI